MIDLSLVLGDIGYPCWLFFDFGLVWCRSMIGECLSSLVEVLVIVRDSFLLYEGKESLRTDRKRVFAR
jgi:hypothetical protein